MLAPCNTLPTPAFGLPHQNGGRDRHFASGTRRGRQAPAWRSGAAQPRPRQGDTYSPYSRKVPVRASTAIVRAAEPSSALEVGHRHSL